MASVVIEVLGAHRYEVRLVGGDVDAARRFADRVMTDDPDRALIVISVDVDDDATVADVLEAAGLN